MREQVRRSTCGIGTDEESRDLEKSLTGHASVVNSAILLIESQQRQCNTFHLQAQVNRKDTSGKLPADEQMRQGKWFERERYFESR